MSKWFWLVLGAGVAILIGAFVLSGGGENTSTTGSNQDPNQITAQDHVRGKPSAKVTLLEYGDFQCPACGYFYPVLKQAEKAYGNKLRFVFRHFPLSNIHPNGFAASRAAEAAGNQGKFFAMHDLLYERQKDWSDSTNAQQIFEQYAVQLGLDLERFKSDYGSNATTALINQHVNLGKAQGVNATPTLYLNSKKIETVRSFAQLKAKLDQVLRKN